MAKKYTISLTDEQKDKLLDITHKGKANARTIRRAHSLLLSDRGLSDTEIAEMLAITEMTVYRTRKRFATLGFEDALFERQRPGAPARLNGAQEAHLIALTCSKAPKGYKKWTLRLLGKRLVEMGIVDGISPETIRQKLKKMRSSPGRECNGAYQQ